MGTIIGLDIGQKREPTALCVAETDYRPMLQRQEAHYLIRHLERLPLGTPFPDIADRLESIEAGIIERTRQHPSLFADVTGLGQPLIDLIKTSLPRARVIAVYFTHGDRRIEAEGNVVTLGKAFLVTNLQTLLQTGRLHLPRTSQAERLAKDLLDFEIRVEENANERYGAFRVGSQDDLVTALGLAVQPEPVSLGIIVPRSR
jgi:hypothetical protein